MGDVLIISQWHQEGTVGDSLRDCDDQGNWMALHEFYADRPDVPHEQMLAEHPDASFECAVPIAHTWILPPEPLRPHDWYRDPALVAAQNEKVRASLEAFLNERLTAMRRHMRSGWWLLGEVRVHVDVELCETVPMPGN